MAAPFSEKNFSGRPSSFGLAAISTWTTAYARLRSRASPPWRSASEQMLQERFSSSLEQVPPVRSRLLPTV